MLPQITRIVKYYYNNLFNYYYHLIDEGKQARDEGLLSCLCHGRCRLGHSSGLRGEGERLRGDRLGNCGLDGVRRPGLLLLMQLLSIKNKYIFLNCKKKN